MHRVRDSESGAAAAATAQTKFQGADDGGDTAGELGDGDEPDLAAGHTGVSTVSAQAEWQGLVSGRRWRGHTVVKAPRPIRSSLARQRRSGERETTHWSRLFRVSFTLLFMMYPGVALKIMQVFNCR